MHLGKTDSWSDRKYTYGFERQLMRPPPQKKRERQYERAPERKGVLPSIDIISLSKAQHLEISLKCREIKELRAILQSTVYMAGMMIYPMVHLNLQQSCCLLYPADALSKAVKK